MRLKLNSLSSSYLLIFSCTFVAVNTFPVDETNFELTADHFEGDMILSEELQQLLAAEEIETGAESKRLPRNARIDKDYRWPNGIVQYQLSDEFSSVEITLIKRAMQHIADNTCIRFEHISEQSSSRTFIFIRPSTRGCSAAVGYQDRGIQYVNLVPMSARSVGCFRFGIIVHELLHALGIYHQHSSSDRDHYVRIRNENIRPGAVHNFRKLPTKFASSFGLGYDYASIMHYSSYAFSWNGEPTIEPLDQSAAHLIGQRRALSKKDILKIRRMYECK